MESNSHFTVREARPDDAAEVSRIYNEGVEDRVATFQTSLSNSTGFAERIRRARPLPLLVADAGGEVLAWAAAIPYSDSDYYAGVGEYQIYVAREARGKGVGAVLLDELAELAAERGFWKLVGKLFASNEASIGLALRCGFREVGVHLRHGRLDGEWRDVMIVERLIGPAARP